MNCARLLAAAALVSALAATFTSPAFADERVSGRITRTYVIVEHTDLVGDVICDVGNNPCFSFGAPDVELRLNGFTMTGQADAVTGCGGAIFAPEFGVTTNGRNNVSVRGPGLVQRFRAHGVLVTGSTGARIEGATLSTNCGSGILVSGNSFGTLIQGNIAVRNGATGGACGGF